jgi:plastocyanin
LNRSSKIAIILGIVAVVLIAAALTVHFRLSETEKSEIQSGAEQNEKESASQVANEIVNSLQNKPESEENESTEPSETTEQNENVEQTEITAPNTTASQIEISIKEIDEVYGWSNSNETNPTITLSANIDNVIQFTNPTNTKHAFIIEAGGTEPLADFDIGPDSTGELTIKPTATGVFEYHCEYHPDTMKGILIVVP